MLTSMARAKLYKCVGLLLLSLALALPVLAAEDDVTQIDDLAASAGAEESVTEEILSSLSSAVEEIPEEIISEDESIVSNTPSDELGTSSPDLELDASGSSPSNDSSPSSDAGGAGNEPVVVDMDYRYIMLFTIALSAGAVLGVNLFGGV